MEVTYDDPDENNRSSEIQLRYEFPEKQEAFSTTESMGGRRSFIKLKTRADQVYFTLKTKGIVYNFHRLLFEASEGSRQTIDR